MTAQWNMAVCVGILGGVLAWPAPAQTTSPAAPPKAPRNLLQDAVWRYSTDGGKTFRHDRPVIAPGQQCEILARTTFDVPDAGSGPHGGLGLEVLELTHGLNPAWAMAFELNGCAIRGPLKGMRYRTIPAIDPQVIKVGRNVLSVRIGARNPQRNTEGISVAAKMSLVGRRAEDLQIQTGPIVGAFGENHYTVTCRTNMPARVSLYRVERPGEPPGRRLTCVSDRGLTHRLTAPVARPDEAQQYFLVADNGAHQVTAAGSVAAFGRNRRKFRFVATGDSRTRADCWARVAGAVLSAGPDLVVFSGDMVSWGLNDWEWDEQFAAPAAGMLATIPFYAVIGNHDANAPLYDDLFHTPTPSGRGRNWSQTIRGVLLIGVDGTGANWSAGGENAKWLEKILAQADQARFIFLFDHYAPWTSSRHGALDEQGLPKEPQIRQSQRVILPLLEKYRATAFIAGHDHCYERSEPPGGVTVVISGGAGAPLYAKAVAAEKQNPHSRVFASRLHYCLFEIDGETCLMQALTPAGEQIDRRLWKGRHSANR